MHTLISKQICKTKEFSPLKLKSQYSKRDGGNGISLKTNGSIDAL